MTKNEGSSLERWARELEAFGRKMQTHGKTLLATNADPFSLREQIERVAKTLSESDLRFLQPPPEVTSRAETDCVEEMAEFWQRFCSAAKEHGWDVHGSTDRRLISRAFFVELKGEIVSVDGLPGKHTPHVTSLIQLLKQHVEKLPSGQQSVQEFIDVLIQAYDVLGGQGDVSIESVFRQAVMTNQSPTFWNLVEPSKFQSLSRPAFRCGLSAALEFGVKPKDGREMRLMPTVNRKDVWELFSPAEGHVVQVGRIGFHKT